MRTVYSQKKVICFSLVYYDWSNYCYLFTPLFCSVSIPSMIDSLSFVCLFDYLKYHLLNMYWTESYLCYKLQRCDYRYNLISSSCFIYSDISTIVNSYFFLLFRRYCWYKYSEARLFMLVFANISIPQPIWEVQRYVDYVIGLIIITLIIDI